MKWGLVPRNVCDLVTPPRKVRFEIQPFTPEQVQSFFDAIAGHKWEALFTLALATGMRQGELLGLKWQDINFTTGTLQVRRILTRVPSRTSPRVFIEAEPKTQHSRRSITIASFAISSPCNSIASVRRRPGSRQTHAGKITITFSARSRERISDPTMWSMSSRSS